MYFLDTDFRDYYTEYVIKAYLQNPSPEYDAFLVAQVDNYINELKDDFQFLPLSELRICLDVTDYQYFPELHDHILR